MASCKKETIVFEAENIYECIERKDGNNEENVGKLLFMINCNWIEYANK